MNFNILHGKSDKLPTQKSPGCIYITDNDSKVYFDVDDSIRLELASIFIIEELPITPVPNKLYLLKPNKLGIYDNGWTWLNNDSESLTKPTDYTEGNIAVFDVDGNIIDSKMKFVVNEDDSLSLQINIEP